MDMPHRLVHRLNGPRGSSLLALALCAAPFAVAYSPLTYQPVGEEPLILPLGLDIATAVVPITFYGILWTSAVILCFAAAWTDENGHQRDRLDRAAWSAIVGLLVVWALAYMIGWGLYLTGWPRAAESQRSYILGGIYTGMAVFIGTCARAMPCREADLETLRKVRYRAAAAAPLRERLAAARTPWRHQGANR